MKEKAILITDMPKMCDECKLHLKVVDDSGEFLSACLVMSKAYNNGSRVQEWCPLRPMPLKRETQVVWQGIGGMKVPTHEPSEYDKGWNDCVEFIEGEKKGLSTDEGWWRDYELYEMQND